LWVLPVLIVGLGMTPTAAFGRGSSARVAALPANGRILFTHCDDANGCQIYTVNPDGSALEQVTGGNGDSFLGDWSPDGRRIAYVGVGSGDSAIWIIDADGGSPHQLTPDDPDSNVVWPRFTPDGRWILYTNCRGDDCDGGIFAVRPNGTGLHHITANSHNSYNEADRAPDGTRMAYMRWHVGGVKMAVYVSSAGGRHQRRISPPRLEGWAPDWSPNGRRIALTSFIFADRPSPSLFTVRPNGSGRIALTHPPFPHSDEWPAYSPNGRKILFVSDRRYRDFCCADMFIVSASGGPVQRVRLPFDAYDARWGTAPRQPASTRTVTTRRPGFAAGGPPGWPQTLGLDARYIAGG
jgi:Tol biopolymer transport system component